MIGQNQRKKTPTYRGHEHSWTHRLAMAVLSIWCTFGLIGAQPSQALSLSLSLPLAAPGLLSQEGQDPAAAFLSAALDVQAGGEYALDASAWETSEGGDDDGDDGCGGKLPGIAEGDLEGVEIAGVHPDALTPPAPRAPTYATAPRAPPLA